MNILALLGAAFVSWCVVTVDHYRENAGFWRGTSRFWRLRCKQLEREIAAEREIDAVCRMRGGPYR